MLSGWANFFALTGTTGATLVGLLFVVVTLATGLSTSRTMEVARVLMTPALYSFTSVLLQSLAVLAPWPSERPVGVVLAILGIGDFAYRIHEIRLRTRLRLKAIQGPVDWIFHNAVPGAASVSLVVGGAALIMGAPFAVFAIAGSSTLFLVSGIYRCWGETLVLLSLRGNA